MARHRVELEQVEYPPEDRREPEWRPVCRTCQWAGASWRRKTSADGQAAWHRAWPAQSVRTQGGVSQR